MCQIFFVFRNLTVEIKLIRLCKKNTLICYFSNKVKIKFFPWECQGEGFRPKNSAIDKVNIKLIDFTSLFMEKKLQ